MDFNSLSWHTLVLVGGGNVLGKAVESSGLLEYIADGITNCKTFTFWLFESWILYLTYDSSSAVGTSMAIAFVYLALLWFYCDVRVAYRGGHYLDAHYCEDWYNSCHS